VQVLSRQNASDAITFDPVFKPFAPDPPRDLPPVIRAGVVMTRMPSSPPIQYMPHSVLKAISNGSPDSYEGRFPRTMLGVFIGAVFLAVLLCSLLGALLVLHLRSLPGKCHQTAVSYHGASSRARLLKNSRLWKKNPLSQTTEVSPV
jgi:hypothetical protein